MAISKIIRLVLVALAAALVLAVIVWVKSGGYADWRRERAISALINAQAAREQVVAQLQLPFVDYSIGSAHRGEFEQWLTRASTTCETGVRARAARYPGVLYHTTAWTMTWLFFDQSGKLRAQFRCVQ